MENRITSQPARAGATGREARRHGTGSDPHAGIRRLLLALLAAAIAGTATELVLLEHYETVWQWTPLAIFGAGLPATFGAAIRPSRRRVRLFQLVMTLFIAAGLAGLYLHYRGNAEFELEMVPALEGLELFWKSITGATPALAPATMTQLGLLGLITTYRHPLLRAGATQTSSREESE